MNILEDIRHTFKHGSSLTRLICINIGVYLLVNIFDVFLFLLDAKAPAHFSLIDWLAVPAQLDNLLSKPWTVLTYMFLHQNFLHILFNMLWLYWFGKIFLQYLSQKQLVWVYVLGGLTGAAVYILSFNLFPVFGKILPLSAALGASASVMAIVIAISVFVPDYTLYLMFIGPVKLKYIAVLSIALDIFSIPTSNSGGHLAHLGGALYGLLFALQLKRGNDVTRSYSRLFESVRGIFRRKPKMKVKYSRDMTDWEYNEDKRKKQEHMDHILDKLAKSGYDSLSKEEKEFLFNMSNRK